MLGTHAATQYIVGANLGCAGKNAGLEFLQVSGFKGVGL
jgi:hypothetical protein